METTCLYGRWRNALEAGFLPVVCVLVLFAAGCVESEPPPALVAVSDTTAYQTAISAGDTTSVIQALSAFLDRYPHSPFRPGAYSRIVSLIDARDPLEAGAFVRDRLKTEMDPASRGRLYYSLYTNARDNDPGRESEVLEALVSEPPLTSTVYNMVAWDLVEREIRLDEAVDLARMGAALAQDSTSKASILDTQGWAEFKRGNLGEAVAILEEAAGLNPEGEIREHLAAAYDRSGRKLEALEIFKDLMIAQENPAIRAVIERLAVETGGRAVEIFGQIDRAREESAWPAPQFTLSDYSGLPISLSDFRGKVVLLNFWHPT